MSSPSTSNQGSRVGGRVPSPAAKRILPQVRCRFGDTPAMAALFLLLLLGLVVICVVALGGFFVLMIRASRAKRVNDMLRSAGSAGLLMVVMLIAFRPLWAVWKQFNTNFGNNLDDRFKFPPIALLYLVWAAVLWIRLAMRTASR